MNINTNDLYTSMAGFGAGIVFFFLVIAFALVIMGILSYVFSSLAFYKFMKNRNLDNAFLAWIPIVSVYTVGKVYDDINEKHSKKTNFSVILLVVNCASVAFSFLRLGSLSTITISSTLSLGLWFAGLILKLICYNLIFKEYTPDDSSYFILTIIFTICPIVPFIPGLCLLKASKNQPVSN